MILIEVIELEQLMIEINVLLPKVRVQVGRLAMLLQQIMEELLSMLPLQKENFRDRNTNFIFVWLNREASMHHHEVVSF